MTAALEIAGLTVRFGGVVAVDALDLVAAAGTVTGLIGPNGAGKTTTFNACTGLVRATAGTVTLGGGRLTGGPARRAAAGLGRTFQQAALWANMTASRNVAIGAEARRAGGHWWKAFAAGRGEARDVAAAAADAMERCGIAALADSPVAALSTGQQRLVELARALAGGFSFLLLDEPSAGLDEQETAAVGAVIASVAAAGTGVLLVEHDMNLVRQVCSSVFVLDFGRLLASGPTGEVLDTAVVRAAYLGDAA